MAFYSDDPVVYAANKATLKTEVTTDPIGMGYNTASDQQVLRPLNDPDSNVGGETKDRIFDQLALLEGLDPTELDAQQTEGGAGAYVQALVAYPGDISSLKAKFISMFASNSVTVTAINAQTRLKSRAEVLFGDDTVITNTDWWAARDS